MRRSLMTKWLCAAVLALVGKAEATVISGKGGTFNQVFKTDLKTYRVAATPEGGYKFVDPQVGAGWFQDALNEREAKAHKTSTDPLKSPGFFGKAVYGRITPITGDGPGTPPKWELVGDRINIHSGDEYVRKIMAWKGKATFSASGGDTDTIKWELSRTSVLMTGTGGSFEIAESDFGPDGKIKKTGEYTISAKDKHGAEDSMALVVSKLEITEPTGEKGDNQFVFTGLAGISRKSEVPAKGTTNVAGEDLNLEWSIDPVPNTDLSSDPNPPKGSEVVFKYKGEPKKNSDYGPKYEIHLSYPPLPNQKVERQIVLFYDPILGNTHDKQKRANWFVYWKQSDVVPALKDFELENNTPGPTMEFGAFVAPNKLFISTDAFLHAGHDSYTVKKDDGTATTIGLDLGANNTDGVYRVKAVASVCKHELMHKTIYEWKKKDPVDSDDDGIPDDKEIELGLEPFDADTWNIGKYIDSSYASYGDNEFLARKAETDFGKINPKNDWSVNGSNWKE